MAQVQLATEIAALHARHPACGFNRSLVVHLDVSAASVALATARLAVRGLLPASAPRRAGTAGTAGAVGIAAAGIAATDTAAAGANVAADGVEAAAAEADAADPGVRVRLVRGSLLELSSLDLGRFDYVNCVGVAHHLPDPAAALRSLAAHALAPRGGLGLMVYGTLGRGGVYETQAPPALVPQPCTLHSAPSTLHRKTLHPAPCALLPRL